MAKGKYHVAAGFSVFVVYSIPYAIIIILLEGYEAFFSFPRVLWLATALLLALLGSILSDFDRYSSPFIRHRSIITHSLFIPFGFTALFLFVSFVNAAALPLDLYLVVSSFLFSSASHLFLDFFPSSKIDAIEKIVKLVADGKYDEARDIMLDLSEKIDKKDESGRRKMFAGRYRIYVPGRKLGLGEVSSKIWLISNGIMLFGFGAGLFIFYGPLRGLVVMGLPNWLPMVAIVVPAVLFIIAVSAVIKSMEKPK